MSIKLPEQNVLKLRITNSARKDIRSIINWSLSEFGTAAALRYELLIFQTLHDIETDPKRLGTINRTDLSINVHTYHLALSRDRDAGKNVKKPRHFILYRITSSVIEIGRILHDSCDLPRHLPKGYEPADETDGIDT